MPSPRTNTKPKSARKKKPPVQHVPAPPRWILLRRQLDLHNGLITIALTTDVPNILTIGYTYQTPSERNALLGVPTYPRPHGPDYNLSSPIFLRQNEPGATVFHTFTILPRGGAWNIYYAAFDGDIPAHSHSRSPILALTYIATEHGAPTVTPVYGYPLNIQPGPGAQALVTCIDIDPTPSLELSSPTELVIPLTGIQSATCGWYQTTNPGCPPNGFVTGHAATYLVRYLTNAPVFSRDFLARAILNAKPNDSPDFSTISQVNPYVCMSGGWSANVAGGYDVKKAQASLFSAAAFGFGGLNAVSPPWPFSQETYILTAADAPIFTFGSSNGDLFTQSTQVIFDYNTEVSFLADITKGWRSFPNPPDVEP